MHLSVQKAMRVMQAGTDGAVKEGGVVKGKPAADGPLTGQHAANVIALMPHAAGRLYHGACSSVLYCYVMY